MNAAGVHVIVDAISAAAHFGNLFCSKPSGTSGAVAKKCNAPARNGELA